MIKESQRVLIERAHQHPPCPSRLDVGLNKSTQEHDCPSCKPKNENPENAAIKIQASYRGFRVRREKKRQEQAAKKIQAGFRGYNTRKKLAEIQNTQKTKGQQEEGQETEPMLQLENSAAKVIQAHYRGYRTRKSLLKQMKKDQDSITRNQTYAMERGKENGGDADGAALKIQAGFRGYRARKIFKQERERMNQAATKIQAGFRGYKTRKNQPKRATIASPRVEQEMGDESIAATKIQATFRGYKTRKQLRDRRPKRPTEEETMAATRIQANYRGYKVRKAITVKKEGIMGGDQEPLMAEE
ncbi:Myosin-IIIa [Cichlidogyrus casuarinus]|uniref:Myosin-IIIa n=1 Tax=Cichlidogyrus casuarinus TaxID=1844966 RepID=A0ABD2Q9P9_9PLAT